MQPERRRQKCLESLKRPNKRLSRRGAARGTRLSTLIARRRDPDRLDGGRPGNRDGAARLPSRWTSRGATQRRAGRGDPARPRPASSRTCRRPLVPGTSRRRTRKEAAPRNTGPTSAELAGEWPRGPGGGGLRACGSCALCVPCRT
uniref:Uncharacterized protein n=1 Tax=Ixodes ricinus TaxID=34613 RepID=A0A6B0UUJ4_IXORI